MSMELEKTSLFLLWLRLQQDFQSGQHFENLPVGPVKASKFTEAIDILHTAPLF